MPYTDLILLSLNLLVIGALILGFLSGLIKGFYKSVVFLGFSIVLFIVGILVIPFLSEMLLDINLSFIGRFIPSEANIEMTSIRETLPDILAYYMPEQASIFVPGTDTMALAYGIVKLVFNIVLFIVLLILNATLFKIIPLIVWIFIKPKRDRLTNEKPKKQRLLGGLVGAVKAFAVLLLVAIPLAGITSIATSAEPLYEKMNQEENPNANNSDIVTLAESDDEDDEDISLVFDVAKTYKKSILGKVYGLGNLDVNLFDVAFKVDIKNDSTKEKLLLRKDVSKALKIADILLEANENSTDFDASYLFKLTEEDIEKVQEEIKALTILNIAKNIGAEFGYDFLEKENLLEGYEDELTLETLKSIDINKEINTLLDIVIIISESENQDEIYGNVLSLTKEEATNVVNKLAELQTVNLGLPIGFNYILNMPETLQTMEENNIDPEDLQRPTEEELMADFKNIINIYGLAKDMGFNDTADFENIDEDFVLAIEDVHIEDLVNVVFNFSILYKNDKLFANLAYEYATEGLDEKYLDIIPRETVVNNFTAGELTSIALLGKLLYTESLFNETETVDFVVVLRDENINKMSDYISGSEILSDGLEGLVDVMLSETDFVAIEIPAYLSLKGEEGKKEIEATLRSVRDMFEIGLTEENFDFKNITDEKIEEIALNFSSSIIIRHNLSPIINQVTSATEYSFITSDEDQSFWTEDEIYYTFKAVKTFATEEVDQNSVHTIEEAKILEVSKSKTVSNAFGSFLEHENEPGGLLDGELYIPIGLVYYSTEEDSGEMYNFFIGAKEIIGENEIEDLNIGMEDVLDMNLDKVFGSKILEATVVENHLKGMPSEENLGKYIVDNYENGEEFDWYMGENPNNLSGDSLPLIKALANLDDLGINYAIMNYSSFIVVLAANPNAAQEINNEVLNSAVLNASMPKMLNELINVQGELNLNVYPNYNKTDLDYWGEIGNNKELFYILDALIVADELGDFDYQSLNNANKEEFKTGAKKISKSETLIQMLPRIIEESNLTMAEDLRSGVDPNSLTEAQWNNEIDVLVEIIVILNENPTLDFDNPNPADIPVVLEIRLLMVDSLLYDESKIIL